MNRFTRRIRITCGAAAGTKLRRAPTLAALALTAATLAAPALAGRPLATDDAAVVAHGHCQLELWQEWRRGEHTTWANPGCNPWGSTELAFGIGRLRAQDEGAATLNTWQVKHLLRETTDDAAGFALALRGERDRRIHGGGLLGGHLGLNAIAS